MERETKLLFGKCQNGSYLDSFTNFLHDEIWKFCKFYIVSWAAFCLTDKWEDERKWQEWRLNIIFTVLKYFIRYFSVPWLVYKCVYTHSEHITHMCVNLFNSSFSGLYHHLKYFYPLLSGARALRPNCPGFSPSFSACKFVVFHH